MDKTLALNSLLIAAQAQPGTAREGVWVQLLPLGRFGDRNGGKGRTNWNISDRAAAERVIAATLKRAARTELMIDYDHQSVGLMNGKTGGTARAAGWMKEFEVRDDGIYARVVWTEVARSAIAAGEYRYLSPTFAIDKAGAVLVIFSAALTNQPALDLQEVQAASVLFNPRQDYSMDNIIEALGLSAGSDESAVLGAINGMLATTAAIAAACGLPEGADADAVKAQVTALKAGSDGFSAIAKAAGVSDTSDAGKVTGAVTTALQARAAAGEPDPAHYVPIAAFTELQTQVVALQKSAADGAASDAVETAMAAGKVTPAQKDWAIKYASGDPQGFAAYVAAAPSLTASQRAQTAPVTAGGAQLSETDLEVIAAAGITKEEFIKMRKEENA